MHLTVSDWLGLALVIVLIAAVLVLENLLTRHLDWPQRWYYAEGLIAVLAGLGIWLAWRQVQVDVVVALALVAAGCAAGGPDWLLLRRQEQRRAAAWAALEAHNAEQAAQLRVLLSKRANSNYMRRLRETVETAAFAAALLKQERELVTLAEQQASELADVLREIIGG